MVAAVGRLARMSRNEPGPESFVFITLKTTSSVGLEDATLLVNVLVAPLTMVPSRNTLALSPLAVCGVRAPGSVGGKVLLEIAKDHAERASERKNRPAQARATAAAAAIRRSGCRPPRHTSRLCRHCPPGDALGYALPPPPPPLPKPPLPPSNPVPRIPHPPPPPPPKPPHWSEPGLH